MTENELAQELYSRHGIVKRARGPFLYTQSGRRITDLYQQDGRAILGWGGGDAFTQLKNVLNRGATGAYITEDNSRMDAAVSALLGSTRRAYCLASKKSAIQAALLLSPQSTAVWLPWQQRLRVPGDCEIIVPPLPWSESIWLLAVKKEAVPPEAEAALAAQEIKIPSPLRAAITRSIYNLIRELGARAEKDWFLYDSVVTKYWERKGPYLYPRVPETEYDSFVRHCLDCEVAINPDARKFSIVPFGADKGVFTRLKNNPFVFKE